MWIKMGCRLLNLDQFAEIRAVKMFDERWVVSLDSGEQTIRLHMDSEDEARRMVEDIAEALHGGAHLIYWYKDQE